MRIVFGWNNFKIKSFDPIELGLTNDLKNEFKIEIRQSYFHLFWIPCFGIGKKWNIRKDGQLYELPAAYAAAIQQQNIKVRSPWYTFLFPILLILGGLGFLGYQKYQMYKYLKYELEAFEKNVVKLTKRINEMTTKDIIKISSNNINIVYLKAEKIKPNSILFSKFITDKDGYDETHSYIENYYLKHPAFLETIEIQKSDLLAAIPKDYEANQMLSNKQINLLKDGNTYIIEEIERYFQPLIEDRGTGSFSNQTISLDLENSGWPCDLIEIKTIEGNINWTNELPMRVEGPIGGYKKAFYINGENYKMKTKYKFELTFKDSTNAIYKYLIEGTDFEKTLTPIN